MGDQNKPTMARFKPIDLIKELRGKLCSHSDIYFQRRARTLCTGKICNPRTKPFSAEELARQTKFTQARAAVKALTQEQIADYATAFKNQTKYVSLQGYMFAMEYAKLGN